MRHAQTLLKATLLVVWPVLAICACTPISPARSAAGEQSGKPDAEVPQDAGDKPEREPERKRDAGSDVPEVHTGIENRVERARSENDARECAIGNPSRQPLKCVEGAWREQAECNEGQRCETAQGPEHGQCVKIARECVGRTPDEHFCDGQTIRSCSGGLSNEVKRCDEQQQCVEQADKVACRCKTGSFEVDGRCKVAGSCDEAGGGCDPLTACSMNGSTRVCSACPAGFLGDGEVGCTPILLSLAAVKATLTPALSADVRAYRINLSLFHGQLDLQPMAAAGVKVEVNDVELSEGAGWRSELLSLGEHPLSITLTSRAGLTSRYDVVVERTGAQEAFIKARYPEKDDTFGYSVAISGDTLAVGATSDDSDVGGVNGDETNNSASESGAVYVFVREGSTWKQQAFLKPEDPQEGAFFGGSLALDGRRDQREHRSCWQRRRVCVSLSE